MDQPTQQRPTYIWDMATLLKLLNHRSTGVQEWAAEHILKLYPEAADKALRRLPHTSDNTAFGLLDSLRDLPLPESGVGSLNQFLHGKAKPHHKAMAAAVLIRHGKAPSDEVLAKLPMEGEYKRLQDTPPGFEFLLRRYASVSDEETGSHLAHALAGGCSANDFLALLEDYSPREQRREFKTLSRLWQRHIPDVSHVKQRSKALGLLRDTLGSTSAPGDIAHSHFPTLAAQLRRSRDHIESISKVAEERELKGMGTFSHEVPLLLSCALALHRDDACMRALSEPSNAIGLWQGLILRPWPVKEVDAALIALLERQPPETLVARLRNTLPLQWAYCTFPLYVLNALKAPELHQIIEEADRHKYGEAIADEVEEAQEEILKDPEALDKLLERWMAQPPESYRLHMLGRYPTEGVVRFLLDHFEHYMSQPFPSEFVDAIQRVGSQQFLRPLAQEWREGEKLIRNTVWLLAKLHGLEKDKSIQHIHRDIEAEEQMKDILEDADMLHDALHNLPLNLPLRCKVCRRTYRYKVEKVFVGKKTEEVSLGQIIQCKGCGSLETYETTQETFAVLGAELMRVTLLMRIEEDGEPPETPLTPQPAKMVASGRLFNSLPEAYHYVKKALEEDPENAELQRRLGNILRNGLRPDLAVPYYQEALRLNPRDVESRYSLADVLLEQERYKEAIPHVETQVSLCRDETLDDEVRRSAFAGLLNHVSLIREKTGRHIELFPAPLELPERSGNREPVVLHLFDLDPDNPRDFEKAYRMFLGKPLPPEELVHSRKMPEPIYTQPTAPLRAEKVGRNEPCPCGSGKKYKRCHGR
jgi:tetratricopeptide (TPR) repeat protein